jgi:histidinol-phosphate aminotransferase
MDLIKQNENKMHFDLNNLIRQNIKDLQPYSSARSEFSGEARVFLDANENSFGSPIKNLSITETDYNRYPDPLQWDLKKKIATIKNTDAEKMLLGNGSDECIDLLFRAFCNPQKDNVIICPPTYGMYKVYANINDVEAKEVNLLLNFQLDIKSLEASIDENTKMIFLCSPNNPTGNSLDREDIEIILNNFDGIVVIDEAYINYSRHRSFLKELNEYPNLVVMQTFSKAWGLAALRLGVVFASAEIIEVLNKIKPPYNINQATQELAMLALDHLQQVNEMIKTTIREREFLENKLKQLSIVEKVYPSDTNFLLVKIKEATSVYNLLKTKGIIVRNRSNVVLCDDCLRITVGTKEENDVLIQILQNF